MLDIEDSTVMAASAIPLDGNPLDKINGLIDITSSFLSVGSFAFPSVKVALEGIMVVGALIKTLNSTIPDQKDPIMDKLLELERNIHSLVDKMNMKFDDMKAFITEINFHDRVIQPNSKLTRYLMDCINHPGKESLQNLKDAYSKYKPLDLAYTVMGLMDHEITNPLKMAMNADLLKTKTTFDKWDTTIRSVLAQFLFLEAFSSGLVSDGGLYDSKRMIEKSLGLFTKIDQWKADYTNSGSYWSGLKTYLEQFVDDSQNQKLNKSEKADKLKKMMDTVLTNDAFYIVVFSGRGEWKKTYAYHCPKADTQMVGCWNRSGCSVFIYRSHEGNKKHPLEYKFMRREVELCKRGKLVYTHSMEDAPKSVANDPIFDAGLICCINIVEKPEVRSANCPNWEWGPGWWITAYMKSRDYNMEIQITLIAAFE
ncbi:hypothetical protein CAEBREN_16814 [Caenorhabditis brenneri]|uniref:Uncharacterized protein n=1 Tax=Caenorhabditis brenneri TaxID=135651 RepID=G0NTM3_CAEBE|nr:hypothetical protein CAEBREN_16814 [Caenorhabditis brenneri]